MFKSLLGIKVLVLHHNNKTFLLILMESDKDILLKVKINLREKQVVIFTDQNLDRLSKWWR
jgi:hypothetical protein